MYTCVCIPYLLPSNRLNDALIDVSLSAPERVCSNVCHNLYLKFTLRKITNQVHQDLAACHRLMQSHICWMLLQVRWIDANANSVDLIRNETQESRSFICHITQQMMPVKWATPQALTVLKAGLHRISKREWDCCDRKKKILFCHWSIKLLLR